jgi:phage terminase large subunit-like protein
VAAVTKVPPHKIKKNNNKKLHESIFHFVQYDKSQPKEFFFYGLKKLEQRSHKCVELRGEYVE